MALVTQNVLKIHHFRRMANRKLLEVKHGNDNDRRQDHREIPNRCVHSHQAPKDF